MILLNEETKKKEKANNNKNVNKLLGGRQKVLNTFESEIFLSRKPTQGTRLKTLTPKKMLQKRLIADAQVKACNTCENLLNENRQIAYF